MSLLDRLIDEEPERLERALRHLVDHPHTFVDVGGLRVAYRRGNLVIEQYEVLEGVSPRDLLEGA